MANTVFYPANPKFQQVSPFAAPDSATSDSLKMGKLFETEFLHACRKIGRTERLEDDRYNKPSCDHFAVFPFSYPSCPHLPGMLTFFECKSTGCANLPMVDIKPHQLEAMARYDHAFHGSYAGFVIHFRGSSEEEVWYMPGKAVQEYLRQNPGAKYLPTEFVKRRGFPIGIDKERTKTRLGERLEIHDFLVRLRRT